MNLLRGKEIKILSVRCSDHSTVLQKKTSAYSKKLRPKNSDKVIRQRTESYLSLMSERSRVIRYIGIGLTR